MTTQSHTYRCTGCAQTETTTEEYGLACHSIADWCPECQGLRDFVDAADSNYWEEWGQPTE